MSTGNRTLTGIWHGQIHIKADISIRDLRFSTTSISELSNVELRQSGITISGIAHISESNMLFGTVFGTPGFEAVYEPQEPVEITGTVTNSQVNLNILDHNLSGNLSNDNNQIVGKVPISKYYAVVSFLKGMFKGSSSNIIEKTGTAIAIGSRLMLPGAFKHEGNFILTRTVEPSEIPNESVDQNEPVTKAVGQPVTAKEEAPSP